MQHRSSIFHPRASMVSANLDPLSFETSEMAVWFRAIFLSSILYPPSSILHPLSSILYFRCTSAS